MRPSRPRLGFVWNTSKEEHTTISGGIGTFYDSVPLNVYAFSHYPEQIITDYLPNGATSGNPQTYLNLTSEAVASDSPLVGQDHKIGNFAPYTTAWNLQVQHHFADHLTMRAKYLENHGSGMVTISPKILDTLFDGLSASYRTASSHCGGSGAVRFKRLEEVKTFEGVETWRQYQPEPQMVYRLAANVDNNPIVSSSWQFPLGHPDTSGPSKH